MDILVAVVAARGMAQVELVLLAVVMVVAWLVVKPVVQQTQAAVLAVWATLQLGRFKLVAQGLLSSELHPQHLLQQDHLL